MCLSTVYLGERSDENTVMRHVALIECRGDMITLTDVMGRERVIEGEIARADLTGGTVVRPKSAA